jgi:SAM-dependent methyltransferase
MVSPPEEYEEEADIWEKTLRGKLGLGRHRILELGVGGGHLLSHLKHDFQATAVDISESMLVLSKKLNSQVKHHLGDMRDLRLNQTFDAVLIHDAVSYLLTEQDLTATFDTAKAHLRQGGLLIMAPDWFQETFSGTRVMHWINSTPAGEVTCIEHVRQPDPEDSTLESVFFYLWTENGRLRIEQDRHTTGLFALNTWLGLMRKAGFHAEHKSFPSYEGGYGGNLLIGRLPA